MAQVRTLLEKPIGKWAGIAFAIVAIGIAAYFIKESLAPSGGIVLLEQGWEREEGSDGGSVEFVDRQAWADVLPGLRAAGCPAQPGAEAG